MELMIDGSGPEAQLEFDCTSVNRTFDLIVREGTKTMFEGKTFISSTPRRFSEIIIIPLAYSGPIDKISAARNQT